MRAGGGTQARERAPAARACKGLGQRTRWARALTLGRIARHRRKGCLTAEVTERHGALVPTILESPPLAPQRSRVSMGTYGGLDGVHQGPNRTGGNAVEYARMRKRGAVGRERPRLL